MKILDVVVHRTDDDIKMEQKILNTNLIRWLKMNGCAYQLKGTNNSVIVLSSEIIKKVNVEFEL